jgi:hypothetical protein
MHLVPLQSADDLNFTREKIKVDAEEMERIRTLIINQLN